MASADEANKSSQPDSAIPSVTTTGGLGFPKLFVTKDTSQLLAGEDLNNFSFDNDIVRRGFVRKVYSILMCQLLVTASFIALFVFSEDAKRLVARNPELLMVSFIVAFVTLCVISCCKETRRAYPMNFVFLSIFTVAESFLLGVISSTYEANEVLLAVGICAIVCFSLTIFAFQTKIDFTPLGGMLFVSLIVLILFGFIAMFWPENNMIRLIYAAIGVLIFSVYLIHDTQLITGQKHRQYTISPEEYVFAALTLYLDIINLLLFMLRLIRILK